MSILKEIYHFLNSPFTKEEDWFGLSKNFVSISVGMTLFLYIFQPSGISEAESVFWVCLGFGIAGALGYFIYEAGFSQLVKRVPIQWTYGKWVVYCIGVLFFIALLNFLFVRYFVFGYMEWELFPAMIRGVFMFGIPVILLMLVFFYREEKKYQGIAEELNAQHKGVPAKEVLIDLSINGIPIQQIKYVEAMQNYVVIGFVDANGELRSQIERATLKSILEKVNESPIVRTHRSFLVNKQAITATTGNSQGLLLTLSDCDKKIPVSRKYVSAFRTK
ncbi:MAG: LytTR family DNA-binding domain-containing protein [Bacteroidota bacterium]